MKKLFNKIIVILFQLALHIVSFYIAFYFAYVLRFKTNFIIDLFPLIKGAQEWQIYQHAMPVILVVWAIVSLYAHFYTKNTFSFYDIFFICFKEVTTTFFILMAITFTYRDIEYSRLLILFAWALSVIFIFLSQVIGVLFEEWFFVSIFGAHRILIVGKGKSVTFLKEYLQKKKKYKTYFYDQNITEEIFNDFIKQKKIEEVVVLRNDLTHAKLLIMAGICESKDIEFKFVPDILEMRMGEIIVDHSFGIPLMHLKSISLHGYNFYFKKIFDIIISINIIAFLVIPVILISILIKLESKGEILFRQKRIGYKSRFFWLYKFRTMVYGADLLIDNLKHLSERGGPVFKMKNDPRVTQIGKILRTFSIDELPQIINVLKGEMSIVGPRPQVVWEAEAYDETARKRLNVLPGITGLWQISGRAQLSYEDMINFDLYYLENWSPGLDIMIILKTIPTILSRSGAY